MNATALDRLAHACPRSVVRAPEMADADERARLLASITDSPAPHRHPVHRPLAAPRKWAVASGIAAAIALVMAIVSVANEPPSPRETVGSAKAGAVPETLGHIRLAVATAQTERRIVRIRSDFGNGVQWEDWIDDGGQRQRSRSLTPNGSPIYDHEMTMVDDVLHVQVISYRDHAWWTYSVRGERKPLTSGAPTPDDILRRLQDGSLREVGRTTIDGREAIDVRSGPEGPGPREHATELWVDPQTYLPFRIVTTMTQTGEVLTSTFEWLPRTAENVAELGVSPPADFAHLAGAPEAGG